MLPSKNKDILGDFDLSRTDKFYFLKIPTYSIENGVVLYEMVLKDLITGETYSCKYRFKELKAVQQSLKNLDPYEIPPFPKTHFWQKTNNNPELIEKRRIGLENYFSHVINDPYLRGYPEVKKIISMCKKDSGPKRRMSGGKLKGEEAEKQRSYSFEKASAEYIPKEQWQRLRRKNTMLS